MSIETTAANVARECLDSVVAYVRELLLVSAYVAVCVAITLPAVTGVGAAIYWGSVQLGVTGYARLAYFAVGVFVLMFAFALLRRLVLALAGAMFGRTRELVF